MPSCQMIKKTFVLILFILTIAAPETGVAAGGFGSLRHRNLGKYLKEAPQAVADAIWSCLQSPTGEIEAELMQEAIDGGFARQIVRHLCNLAQKKVEEDGNTLQIEKELEKVEKMPVAQQEEGKKLDHRSYQPKGLWNMSDEQHQALSRAVMTAIRSPTKQVHPKALSEAVATGMKAETVIASVGIAVDSAVPQKNG